MIDGEFIVQNWLNAYKDGSGRSDRADIVTLPKGF